jgi:hypothetical protein
MMEVKKIKSERRIHLLSRALVMDIFVFISMEVAILTSIFYTVDLRIIRDPCTFAKEFALETAARFQ